MKKNLGFDSVSSSFLKLKGRIFFYFFTAEIQAEVHPASSSSLPHLLPGFNKLLKTLHSAWMFLLLVCPLQSTAHEVHLSLALFLSLLFKRPGWRFVTR